MAPFVYFKSTNRNAFLTFYSSTFRNPRPDGKSCQRALRRNEKTHAMQITCTKTSKSLRRLPRRAENLYTCLYDYSSMLRRQRMLSIENGEMCSEHDEKCYVIFHSCGKLVILL